MTPSKKSALLKRRILVLHGDRDESFHSHKEKKYSRLPRNLKDFTGSSEPHTTTLSLLAAKSTTRALREFIESTFAANEKISHQP